MSRPSNSIPSYRHHRPSGQAVVTIRTTTGRKDVYLGPYGSKESRQEYARIIGQIQESPRGLLPGRIAGARASVNEVLLAFLEHAAVHYAASDGSETREFGEYRQCCKLIRTHFGDTRADEFGPVALKYLRQKFIESGLCRRLVNNRVSRVRRVFKWAVSEELVPATVNHALSTVTGLQAGRTTARETTPIGPVSDDVVNATLPHLNPTVRAMVQVQRLTGMRPGEVCKLRPCDIDRTDSVWLFRPEKHKTAWRGKTRVAAIGPKAQEILSQFEPDAPTQLFFSPRRTMERIRAERAAQRKTKLFPSHAKMNLCRRRKRPRRKPSEAYRVAAYGHAIAKACERAFPPGGSLARHDGESLAKWWNRLSEAEREQVRLWRRSHRWHPNQLRHSFATSVRKEHGLEAAQVLLGHSRADVTQVYAERDLGLAVRIAAEQG